MFAGVSFRAVSQIVFAEASRALDPGLLERPRAMLALAVLKPILRARSGLPTFSTAGSRRTGTSCSRSTSSASRKRHVNAQPPTPTPKGFRAARLRVFSMLEIRGGALLRFGCSAEQ